MVKTLIKIRVDQVVEVIVVAPTWLRRSWYHLMLQKACKIPFLLPLKMDLPSQQLVAKGMLFHSDLKTVRLAAWKLSSKPTRVLSDARWQAYSSWCVKRDFNPTLQRQVLGFLQWKSRTLQMNTVKGYVMAISIGMHPSMHNL